MEHHPDEFAVQKISLDGQFNVPNSRLTEVDGQDGQKGSGIEKAGTAILSLEVRIDVGSSLGEKDTEDDECIDPRVLLKCVDDLEAEDGHDV